MSKQAVPLSTTHTALAMAHTVHIANAKRYANEKGEWEGYADKCTAAAADLEQTARLIAQHNEDETEDAE